MKKRIIRFTSLLLLVIISIITHLGILHAQDTHTVLKLVVSSDSQATLRFSEQLIKDFEATYPNIKVELVPTKERELFRTYLTIDDYLDVYQRYAAEGDVLTLHTLWMPWTAIQTGYFLDLAPLVKADPELNSTDFYSAVWQSFQMDNGFWAMPATADVLMLSYTASMFDNRDLPYPTEQWTRDDLEKAAIALVDRNRRTKEIKAPGLGVHYKTRDMQLIRGLLAKNVFDSSTMPATPHLNTPEIEAVIEWWVKLNTQGYAGSANSRPIGVWQAGWWKGNPQDSQQGSLLPGGKAGLLVEGFALSAGTHHPQEAYELAKFLTTRLELLNTPLVALPARKNLDGLTDFYDTSYQGMTFSSEIQTSVEKVLESGLPASDMRFMEYVYFAFDNMMKNNIDAKTALIAAEDQAIADMRIVAERKSKDVIVVAPSDSEVELPAGKIAVNFGVVPTAMPLPNQDRWNAVIAEFSGSDPQVGKINLNVDGQADLIKLAQSQDCFYLPYNAVPGLPPGFILNLDPFLSTDTTFDKADVVPGALGQVQRDNKTWALPIAITPIVIEYNSEAFTKAGIAVPTANWTINEFVDALKALKTASDEVPPVASDVTANGTHLLALIAAYGGLPLDYRTDPVTVNFTDPETMDAIRQVLDLVKQGYIKYAPLAAGGSVTLGNPDKAPLYSQMFNASRFQSGTGYKVALFPTGSKYVPLSYSVGTGYISANAQNPEACYRWLSTLSKHPELFGAMPALRSIISDSALVSSQGQDVVTFYNDFEKLLQEPTAVPIPTVLGGQIAPANYALQRWLFKAFDNYVLNTGDLVASLKEAEGYALNFQGCIANLSDTGGQDALTSRFIQVNECAIKADPNFQQ